jgi:hypothetical protein
MRVMILATAALLASVTSGFAVKVDCEPARCAVQSAINTDCSCTEADNHGRYVSCVAHVVRRLAADGTIPINCKGKVTRCAARSTCGKDGFVTCQIPTDDCVIPVGAATGTCAGDATIVCTTDLDCGAKCKIKSSSDRCAAAGGFVGLSPTCCPSCGD